MSKEALKLLLLEGRRRSSSPSYFTGQRIGQAGKVRCVGDTRVRNVALWRRRRGEPEKIKEGKERPGGKKHRVVGYRV